jgi:hypothetical protein
MESTTGEGLKTFINMVSKRTLKNRKIERALIQKTGLKERELKVYSDYSDFEERSIPSSRSSRREFRKAPKRDSTRAESKEKAEGYIVKMGLKIPLLKQIKNINSNSESLLVNEFLSSGYISPRYTSNQQIGSEKVISPKHSYFQFNPDGGVKEAPVISARGERSDSVEKFINFHMELKRKLKRKNKESAEKNISISNK